MLKPYHSVIVRHTPEYPRHLATPWWPAADFPTRSIGAFATEGEAHAWAAAHGHLAGHPYEVRRYDPVLDIYREMLREGAEGAGIPLDADGEAPSLALLLLAKEEAWRAYAAATIHSDEERAASIAHDGAQYAWYHATAERAQRQGLQPLAFTYERQPATHDDAAWYAERQGTARAAHWRTI